MDAPAVALSAVLGLLAGWFVVVRVVERIPEPSPLPRPAQIAIAVVNSALWAAVAQKAELHRGLVAVTYFVVFSTLLAVSVVDLRVYRIPDRILFPALGLTLVLLTVATFGIVRPTSSAFDVLKHAAIGMVVYFVILFLFHLVSPRGMGFGDVKLALLMGLALGWPAASGFDAMYLVLIALFLGCVFGIVFGLAMRLIKGRGGAFPFGPALALACIYVVLTFEKYRTGV
jgi:leader peptidase (prepilin peptidase)/N-methyltransferase